MTLGLPRPPPIVEIEEGAKKAFVLLTPVGTPTFGVGTSASGRDYRLGYRVGALGGAGTKFELGVDAQRRERSLQGGTDHGALARATMRW